MVVTGLARQFGGRDALCCGPDTGSVRYLTPAEWGAKRITLRASLSRGSDDGPFLGMTDPADPDVWPQWRVFFHRLSMSGNGKRADNPKPEGGL